MLSVSQQASVIKMAYGFAGWCQAHAESAETWKIHLAPQSLCGVKPCCKNDLRSAQRCLCQQHLCPRVLLWDFDREVFFSLLCFIFLFSFSLDSRRSVLQLSGWHYHKHRVAFIHPYFIISLHLHLRRPPC